MTSEFMTDSQILEQRITDALVTIRREWAHMMPTGPAPIRYGVGRAAGIVGDNSPPKWRSDGTPWWPADNVDTNDVDGTTALVSLRRSVTDSLNSWSRIVMEDRPVEKALPDGLSAVSMCAFLERHAQWMSGHGAAEDMAVEVEGLAGKVKAVTQPQRREWINLGSCPMEIEVVGEMGDEGQHGDLTMQVCAGQVRAWPRETDDDGQVMARCRRCGVEAVASWWERQMFDDAELKVLLTADEVVTFVHRAYGKVIKAATVRQWDKRGTIEPADTDERGRKLYAREALVWALDLKERREVMGL